MSSNLESISGDCDTKTSIIISRRCIILSLVSFTPNDTSTLELILQNGYLNVVKLWMDDILNGSLGEFPVYICSCLSRFRHLIETTFTVLN